MIQIALYISAGFLTAALIALLALPFLTGHAANTAVRRLRAKLPFSTAEMAAEKDQLRAEFAIALRKVEIDLTKQSEKVAKQNIEIRELTEKLNGASKVGKASKLALEEIRGKEHDLNERLRQRDAQYAGLEQRSRQMLRENRELKLELKKEGKDVKAILAGRAEKPKSGKPSTSKSGLPIADVAFAKEEAELSVQHLRKALSEAHHENKVAERQIISLKKSIAAEKDNAADIKAQLPKAAVPINLGGSQDATANDAIRAENALERYPDVQNQILDLAASLTAITSLLEDDDPKISKILKDTKSDPEGALGARIKALLDADKESKPATKTKHTTPLKVQTGTQASAVKPTKTLKSSAKDALIKELKKANIEMPKARDLELTKDARTQSMTNRTPASSARKPSQSANARSATKQSTNNGTATKKIEKA